MGAPAPKFRDERKPDAPITPEVGAAVTRILTSEGIQGSLTKEEIAALFDDADHEICGPADRRVP